MLEIEAKYVLPDPTALLDRLAEWGVAESESHTETDHYFNAPDRDFARTNEAFRLRRIGGANYLTYKGPRLEGPTKTRLETELRIADGDESAVEITSLFEQLGYRPVATVSKHRRSFPLARDGFDLQICVDAVEGVGTFAEVEILAEESRRDDADAVLLRTAGELGLTEREHRSYLRMVLQTQMAEGGELPPVVRTVAEVRDAVRRARKSEALIGLVPTMGALHRGHTALIQATAREADFVVVTIFVNPTQFGPNEDLDRYPKQLEADRRAAAEAGASLIFAPPPEEMYPPGFTTWVEVAGLSDVLCGPSRPGHFRGVATVVLKLLNIVQADVAVFGQKDAQQALIIRRLAADLNVPTEIRIEPTVREEDGLALSSRNQYLSAAERKQAVVLSRALREAAGAVADGERDVAELERLLAETIGTAPDARIDYARILDAESLTEIDRIDESALAALAVFFGDTRLIDNVLLVPTE